MNDILETLGHWQLDVKAVRERMYGAATARERERWHAVWLLACGWSATQVARRWSGMRTRSATGRKRCASKVPRVWRLSRAVVPPRPRPRAAG